MLSDPFKGSSSNHPFYGWWVISRIPPTTLPLSIPPCPSHLIHPAPDTGHQCPEIVMFQLHQKIKISVCLKKFFENFYQLLLGHSNEPVDMFDDLSMMCLRIGKFQRRYGGSRKTRRCHFVIQDKTGVELWCRRRDSNSHGHKPTRP